MKKQTSGLSKGHSKGHSLFRGFYLGAFVIAIVAWGWSLRAQPEASPADLTSSTLQVEDASDTTADLSPEQLRLQKLEARVALLEAALLKLGGGANASQSATRTPAVREWDFDRLERRVDDLESRRQSREFALDSLQREISRLNSRLDRMEMRIRR